MIEYIISGTIVLALSILYINYKKGIHNLFDRLCSIYLLYVIVHAVYIIVSINLPLSEMHVAGSPFIFGYGPFFFMGLKSLTKNEISNTQISLNFAPLVVFSAVYILLLGNSKLSIKYSLLFYIIECIFVVASLFGYAFWAMFVMRPSQGKNKTGKLKMQLVKTAAASLLLMGLFFTGAAVMGIFLREDVGAGVTGLIIYLGIFVSLIMAFIYSVNNNNTVRENLGAEESGDLLTIEEKSAIEKVPAIQKIKIEKTVVKDKENIQKYNKSALSPVVLKDYKDKLNRLINADKVYLDNELSLEALSKLMKMPMHHLTQLFNVYLGENFNQYINRYRVEYAKELLEDNEDSLSVEQIAYNSGFNSKVSFNRHFKILTGYTPKEYVTNYKSVKK